jgi:uncharacterized protein (DUF433 family)
MQLADRQITKPFRFPKEVYPFWSLWRLWRASVERSPAHHVQRSSEGAQVYAVQHLAYYNAVADQSLITVDREILGGTPVFSGTRVPVKTLFEYLEDNYSLDEFIECFPTVSREMAHRILEESKDALLEPA